MIKNFCKAGYPALWIRTHEEKRVIEAECADAPKGYKCFSWDVVSGLKDHSTGKVQPLGDPLKAINTTASLPSPFRPITFRIPVRVRSVPSIWRRSAPIARYLSRHCSNVIP